MSKLAKVVRSDYRKAQMAVNALYAFQKKGMAEVIKDFQHNVIKILAYHLANMPEVNYGYYITTRLDKTIQAELSAQSEVTFKRLKPLWIKLSRDLHLMGRLIGGFLSRKSQPPWLPVKLDLKSPEPHGKGVPKWSEVIPYYFKRVESLIMDQVHIGIKNEESVTQIMKRVKDLFPPMKKKFTEGRKITKKEDDEGNVQITATAFDQPVVEVIDGTYSAQDVASLQDEQKEAMDWYNRDYNANMDEAVWTRNKALMGLERDLQTDVIDKLHRGMIQIGSDNMGIKDFTWIASKGRNECDICLSRDNLTMTEIKDKFGSGGFGSKGGVYPYNLTQDSPPPLHPHCKCQLVPTINDEWSKNALQSQGYEWDTDSGMAFNPTAQQREMGFTDMSWGQWLGSMKDRYGQSVAQ